MSSNVSPPWLWLWLMIFLILSLPYYVAVWGRNIQELLASPNSGLGWITTSAYRILGLVGLLELVPSFALLLGLLALLRPALRRNRLEKDYKLKPITSPTPVMAEILEFVHQHAPGIEVRANRLRFDQTPFVYPLEFNKTAIAIFGQFIRLWRADRPAAEAILLHELAHYRHGDALLIGAGSPFRAVVEQWGRLYLHLFLLPFLLSFAAITLLFFWEIGQLAQLGVGGIGMLAQVIFHTIGQALFMALGALITSFGLLIWIASIFIVPMTAIWCSELNADQAPTAHSQQETFNTLKKLPEKARGRRWLLYRLAHPPNRLRQWMVINSNNLFGKVSLLLLFPLSFGLKVLLMRLLEAIASVQGIAIVPISWVASTFTLSIIWLITALVLAVWPFCAPLWEQLLSGSKQSASLNSLPYWISACILTGVSIVQLSHS